ncbi:hypothetical protein CRYUN_Cryun38cG0008600 [Craigia yunnanensis]
MQWCRSRGVQGGLRVLVVWVKGVRLLGLGSLGCRDKLMSGDGVWAKMFRHRNEDCGSAFCGNFNISYPFRLKTQPRNCDYHRLELECENNNRTTLVMKHEKFSVKEIFYHNYTMRVVDASLDRDDCNSLSLSSLDLEYHCENPYSVYLANDYPTRFSIMYLVNCTRPTKSSLYVDASRCANSSSRPSSYFYFMDGNTQPSDFNQSCTVEAEVPITVNNILGMSSLDIYKKLSKGFLLSWEYYDLPCSYKRSFQRGVILLKPLFGIPCLIALVIYKWRRRQLSMDDAILLKPLFGIPCLLALVIYKWRRRHLSMGDAIEEFLQSQNNLAPIRNSFKEIKKMTKNFKDKLGEGHYGSVFKGKLRSGYYVAIKLLGKSKANDQDFINEVASIGRIYHVNVVKLIGFCLEGSKQALVYDFMVNGSLDKIIVLEEKKNTLDENFNPKVSDFGLAKLYSVEDSIVSLTAARGTIGYIAPELVYKNLGGISYKADVYSFGMLLTEMIGRRKNLNEFVDHTSQIYFPLWLYDRLEQGEDIELGDVTDGEKIMVRKMVVVAFWCIQMKPVNRPSMSKVLKMLETDVELLEMPPRPFYHLLETSSKGHVTENPIDEPTASLQTVAISSLNIYYSCTGDHLVVSIDNWLVPALDIDVFQIGDFCSLLVLCLFCLGAPNGAANLLLLLGLAASFPLLHRRPVFAPLRAPTRDEEAQTHQHRANAAPDDANRPGPVARPMQRLLCPSRRQLTLSLGQLGLAPASPNQPSSAPVQLIRWCFSP